MQPGKFTDEQKALIDLLLQYPAAIKKGEESRGVPSKTITKEEMIRRMWEKANGRQR